MKYYKKKNVKVETVEKYIVTRIKCDVCSDDIKTNDEYCEITEYPNYPEDSLYTSYCHKKCLLDYVKENYHNHIEIEEYDFSPYEDDDIDYGDIEEKESE